MNLQNSSEFKHLRWCTDSIVDHILFISIENVFLISLCLLQGRVIHNSSPEWQQIKEATEKARDADVTTGDEVGELTCTELLEALELSRCLFLMKYEHP